METPKDYTVKTFKAGDFKDQNGNTWCEVSFEEYASEPIKWVVKDPTTVKVGQQVYGHIEVKTSKADKPYNRFYRDQRDVHTNPTSVGAIAGKKEWQPRSDDTQESIARSVALKASVDFWSGNEAKESMVLATADTFLAWLQGSKPKIDLSPDPMDRVFNNTEPYEGDPSEIPFTD